MKTVQINRRNRIAQQTQRASAVFDNGRRGEPLLGCDCVQCFGYCMLTGDRQHDTAPRAAREE